MSDITKRLDDLEESARALAELVTGILGVLTDEQRATVVQVIEEVRSELEENDR